MVTSIERKPLEFYLEQKYPVTLIPDETGGYVVEIEDLPGCFSQGETAEEALQMIEEARQLWLETAYEDGLDIPLPRTEKEYSGKLVLRMPRSLHALLDRRAQMEGVSLNHYLVTALAREVGYDQACSRREKSTTKS